MNLDELRTVQSKERRKDSLQHLRDSFYDDVAAYIGGLKAERSEAAERADDPFSSPEVSRLTDEIETAEEVAEAVYERRVGKVVKLASFAAADMPVDREGMTSQERDLFEDLVARISENKQTVLETLSGERTPDAGATANADADADAGAHVESASAETRANAADSPADSSAASNPNPASGASDSAGGGPAEQDTTSPSRSRADDVLADAMGAHDDSPQGADAGAGASDADASPDARDGDASPESTAPETGATDVPEDVPPEFDRAVEPDVADVAAPSSDADESDPAPPAEREAESGAGPDDPDPTTASTAATSADAAQANADDTDRTTVRITRDVGAIFGVDEREYDLEREDVVTLPTQNADPLVEREAAERLE